MANTITKKVGNTCELSVFENALKGENKKFIPVTIIIGGYLYIKPNMVKDKNNKWFVSYPSYRDKNGEYINTVFAKREFTEAITKAFNEIINDNKLEMLPDGMEIKDLDTLPF